MSLLKQAEKYKKKMMPGQYVMFINTVKIAVDLNAKNTANFKSRDLAELQIKDLAEKYLRGK